MDNLASSTFLIVSEIWLYIQRLCCILARMFDRCLYFNANHLFRVVNRIWSEAYRELELSPAHAYLLRLVLDDPNLTQKEIGDLLHLEKSTITRFVDKMVGDGYLVRCQVQVEARSAIFVRPTKKALRIKDRLNELGDELYRKMKALLGEEELKLMVDSISRAAYRLSD